MELFDSALAQLGALGVLALLAAVLVLALLRLLSRQQVVISEHIVASTRVQERLTAALTALTAVLRARPAPAGGSGHRPAP